MKKQIVARNQVRTLMGQKILQMCFDAKSINNFSPGFKMVYAHDDPPIFVTLEEIDTELTKHTIY